MDKLFYLILFLIGISLTVFGHQSIGPAGLLTMLLGLAALISLLWLYNRKYK
ncbi:hypothetical protein [Cohnella sp. AR92]|uniref:DUF6903 family protein n=1 Tax=Cohnella sp. AR92 TaxID=648716 RepID=UPI0018653989|nr:hypothetical protein [Cohnella sp. AR92]